MESKKLLGNIQRVLDSVGIDRHIDTDRLRRPEIGASRREYLTELEENLRSMIDSFSDDERLASTLMRLANLHFQDGNLGKAIMLYEVVLGIESNRPETLMYMGIAYLFADKPNEAVECFRVINRMQPDEAEVLAYLALAEVHAGELSRARRHLDRAVALAPESDRTKYVKALFLEAMRKKEEAVSELEHLLEINPGSFPALLELARMKTEQGEIEAAKKLLDRALNMDPAHPIALSALGDLFFNLGEYESSLYYFDKALGINPKSSQLWVKKGDAHLALKGVEQAHNAYEKAVSLDMENAEAWMKNGELLALQGNKDAALKCYDTAISLEPENADYAFKRGKFHMATGRLEAALIDFDLALAAEPSNPIHVYQRAIVLELLHRPQEAKRTWEIARDLYESSGNATKAAECSARARRLA